MRSFEKEFTKEISFPLGGIGTGSIGLAGNGRLMDWEIFNRPDKGSMNGYSHFAVRAIDENGKITAKALCGDILKDYIGQYSKKIFTGYGFGVAGHTMAGFPHFPQWKFESEFPFAQVSFHADDFPADVVLHAFNPFIPMDENDSSIPAAFFEVELKNTSDQNMRFSAAFSVKRPFSGKNSVITLNESPAIFMQSDADPNVADYRDMTLLCQGKNVQTQPYWYRGKWQDSIATFWREFSKCETLLPRVYEEIKSSDTCTVCADVTIPKGKSKKIRFLLAWNTPNCVNDWDSDAAKDENGNDILWKNYYATLWEDSRASCLYAARNWDSLEARSRRFSNALFACTIDQRIMDVATANLCTLKSPTVLRLEDGSLWGWEGVHEKMGSCPGSCTHVWNYAYALPFLFPRLERSLRENDYRYNMFDNGMMAFRIKLPAGKAEGKPLPCLDGQMGGVIKVYRDWKISGDTEWLRGIWKSVKKALEYAWVDDGQFSWDADRDGVLEGRQHHTLDMELFGPSGWLQGFYLGALKAAAEMADALGEADDAVIYRDLFKKGSAWTEKNLFNGEYYIQKLDLTDRSLPAKFGVEESYWNNETEEIKYQIGNGCEIDQLVAQWHAELCGLGDIFDPENRKIALKNLYKNNFKPSMRNFVNPWRIFAVNDEAGTIMCDYPEGVAKPKIPLPYCEECMSGFEYALAGLMLAEGMKEEGMELISAVHDRYDGYKRNPFNEIECGNNYARSMATWALIPIVSGFRYDMTNGMMGFFPRSTCKTFFSVWFCGNAWGTVEILREEKITLHIKHGSVLLKQFEFDAQWQAVDVICDGKSVNFKNRKNGITLDEPYEIKEDFQIYL